ncbi:carboxyl transferase domain-containing protein [Hydrogenophaga atypica]|uniref:Carboxyl transferase domain-containing protein n=1 Tax=Hydrogenophaga atypica TaxID=249409 RepID=A0ABW2QL50_9BURK
MRAPLQAQLVSWLVKPGDTVAAGQPLVILEAMKMEHELRAEGAVRVTDILLAEGETVQEGELLMRAAPATLADNLAANSAQTGAATQPDTGPRPDLQAVLDRHAFTLDAARPEAMAKRHGLGQRSAREFIASVCEPDSFIEYGALAVAAQRSRRSDADLQKNTPADGLVGGIGQVGAASAVVMAYDATVLAGTQGMRNHQKTDRLLGVALAQKLPVLLWAEGGGGRPGDVDMPIVAGLHVGTFAALARLSGQVPLIGATGGRCFAGNAALLGCCDIVIATRASNIGMGGPAMVEGGGLGVFKPDQIGPSDVQHANGVIDVLVDDEVQAAAVARQALSYFQGMQPAGEAPDPQALRDVVPENRLRAYDSRAAVTGLADVGSVLWLREGYGRSLHTALARVAGRPVGVVASNPQHLGGAVDADAAEKLTRFLRLCDTHGLPVVSLVDTPGFMVGPDAEATGLVRRVGDLFNQTARLRVPYLAVVLRKGYGLGAMGLTAGGFHAPVFTVAWPTGEFGAMGLEGAVRLGFRKELEGVPEGPAREALFEQLLAQQYAAGSATNMAATLEIDAVIDPADTRRWVERALGAR